MLYKSSHLSTTSCYLILLQARLRKASPCAPCLRHHAYLASCGMRSWPAVVCEFGQLWNAASVGLILSRKVGAVRCLIGWLPLTGRLRSALIVAGKQGTGGHTYCSHTECIRCCESSAQV